MAQKISYGATLQGAAFLRPLATRGENGVKLFFRHASKVLLSSCLIKTEIYENYFPCTENKLLVTEINFCHFHRF